MNRKTFALALCFFLMTLGWLAYSVRELVRCVCGCHLFYVSLSTAVLVVAGCMVYNEYHRKRRRHLDEVNRHKIP